MMGISETRIRVSLCFESGCLEAEPEIGIQCPRLIGGEAGEPGQRDRHGKCWQEPCFSLIPQGILQHKPQARGLASCIHMSRSRWLLLGQRPFSDQGPICEPSAANTVTEEWDIGPKKGIGKGIITPHENLEEVSLSQALPPSRPLSPCPD